MLKAKNLQLYLKWYIFSYFLFRHFGNREMISSHVLIMWTQTLIVEVINYRVFLRTLQIKGRIHEVNNPNCALSITFTPRCTLQIHFSASAFSQHSFLGSQKHFKSCGKLFKTCLYVLVMSRTRFKVNSHAMVTWMSRNSFLEAAAKFDV